MPLCRLCGAVLRDTFVDLGTSPLCEKYVEPDRLDQPEPMFPLHAWVCRACLLVQLETVVPAQANFDEYAYFSSFSDSWVEHARAYAHHVIDRFGIGPGDAIVEIASNDGYLLQHFVARGFRVLGVDPAANVARAAEAKGVPTLVAYFGRAVAESLRASHGPADLLVGNNVLAHVPALDDFVSGLQTLLAPAGVLTLEFPHLLRLIEECQFDTIYHEHYSYFSLMTAERALARHGLAIFDVDELATHGGSLRLYAQHAVTGRQETTGRVAAVRDKERERGLDRLDAYRGFTPRVEQIREALLAFLRGARASGRTVIGYGAPGKGNTLLHYCGVTPELLPFTVDRNPYKQGKFTPGTHIPIHAPERLLQARPDFVLVLPWNLKQEILAQLSIIREWGGRFVLPLPEVLVV